MKHILGKNSRKWTVRNNIRLQEEKIDIKYTLQGVGTENKSLVNVLDSEDSQDSKKL